MQVKRKMSGGKSAHSFYPAPGIYHLRLASPARSAVSVHCFTKSFWIATSRKCWNAAEREDGGDSGCRTGYTGSLCVYRMSMRRKTDGRRPITLCHFHRGRSRLNRPMCWEAPLQKNCDWIIRSLLSHTLIKRSFHH